MSNKSNNLSNMFANLNSDSDQQTVNIYDFSERNSGEVNHRIKAERKSRRYNLKQSSMYIDIDLKPRLLQKLLTENSDRGEMTQLINDLLYLYVEGRIVLPKDDRS
mgnify:CR=1 FL=1